MKKLKCQMCLILISGAPAALLTENNNTDKQLQFLCSRVKLKL